MFTVLTKKMVFPLIRFNFNSAATKANLSPSSHLKKKKESLVINRNDTLTANRKKQEADNIQFINE